MNKLNMVALFCIVLFFLSIIGMGYYSSDTKHILKKESVTATIREMYPPKHFRMDLIYNGRIYKSVSVSKHCNGWKEKFKVGDQVQVWYYEIQVTGNWSKKSRIIYDIGAKHLC